MLEACMKVQCNYCWVIAAGGAFQLQLGSKRWWWINQCGTDLGFGREETGCAVCDRWFGGVFLCVRACMVVCLFLNASWIAHQLREERTYVGNVECQSTGWLVLGLLFTKAAPERKYIWGLWGQSGNSIWFKNKVIKAPMGQREEVKES